LWDSSTLGRTTGQSIGFGSFGLSPANAFEAVATSNAKDTRASKRIFFGL
jgi:hypothetical protein